jgi:TolB-like protein
MRHRYGLALDQSRSTSCCNGKGGSGGRCLASTQVLCNHVGLTDRRTNRYKNNMEEAELRLGPFSIDAATHTLRRDGELLPISQRAIALLVALSRADGAPVSKDVLLNAAWPGLTVEEANLTVQIAALRKALGPRDDGQEWIVTLPRVGYRLLRPPAQLAATAEERLPTLAVLPFENHSGDPDQDYFADGMVDELITALSRFRGFAVIARSSSFAYRRRAVDIRSVAGELGVRYLVEGSVRRGGDRLRLAAALVDGEDGATLWAQSFEGRIDEVFAFQDHITAAVAVVVAPRIQRAESARAERRQPGSIAAYDLRLRATTALYRFTPDDNEQAIGWLESALMIEPDNGPLKGLLCWAFEMRDTFSWPPHGPNDRERCIALAHEAVQQVGDDAFILSHCSLALQTVGHEWERGLMVAMRAAEINPNDSQVLAKAAVANVNCGDLATARRFVERVIAIQPQDAYEAMGLLALNCCYSGNFDEAIPWAGRSIAVSPGYLPAHWAMVIACVNLGRLDEARKALTALLDLEPDLTTAAFARLRYGEVIVEAMRAAGLPD